jgi:carboxylesterase type B
LYPPEHGVAHTDDLFIMFKAHKLPLETVFTEEDKATSKNVLTIWTDFATTGNPTLDPDALGVRWKK